MIDPRPDDAEPPDRRWLRKTIKPTAYLTTMRTEIGTTATPLGAVAWSWTLSGGVELEIFGAVRRPDQLTRGQVRLLLYAANGGTP